MIINFRFKRGKAGDAPQIADKTLRVLDRTPNVSTACISLRLMNGFKNEAYLERIKLIHQTYKILLDKVASFTHLTTISLITDDAGAVVLSTFFGTEALSTVHTFVFRTNTDRWPAELVWSPFNFLRRLTVESSGAQWNLMLFSSGFTPPSLEELHIRSRTSWELGNFDNSLVSCGLARSFGRFLARRVY